VYFYDPDLQRYFAIPYRNTTHPSISLWELRQVRRRLKAEGQHAVNEELIFDAYNRLRALEDEALRDTKKARRVAQQRRLHARAERLAPAPSVLTPDVPVGTLDDIQPYDEIEELDV
jgi:putative transposase